VCALAPDTFTTPLIKTIATLHHLHPLAEVDFPPFVNDFHPKMNFILDRKTFIFTLARSPCLLSNSPLGMVYELLQDCFVLNDFGSGFDLFFEICGHIVHGHLLPFASRLLVTS
jgi:hypothetical protein